MKYEFLYKINCKRFKNEDFSFVWIVNMIVMGNMLQKKKGLFDDKKNII